MTGGLITLVAILWYASGVASFIYWWTTQHDLSPDDLLIGLLVGIIGPLAWPVGYSVHGERKPTILIPRRK